MDTQQSILPRLLPVAIPPAFSKFASRVLGFDDLSRTYAAVQSKDTTRPITNRVLEELEVTYRVAPSELERVPRTGSVMVVANHPFGILEGVVLGAALLERRKDVRFLANGLLTAAIPELSDLIIPVDPMGGKSATAANPGGMRAAIEHLQAGGLLVVFPAGEVSHFHWRERASCDPAWSSSVARMLRLAARGNGAPPQVVPLFLDGANSALFHMAGMIHPRLRTALLARELMNKRRTVVRMRVGKPVQYEKLDAMGSDRERVEYLRWRTYLLDRREKAAPSRPRARSGSQAAIADPGDAECLREEVEALGANCLMASAGDLDVYLAEASAIPHVLREIARLREITFRAVGEGTGRAVDIDRFDSHYLHLFVWNKRKAEIAGAYRLAASDRGPAGLYTNTLFHFGQAFLDRLGPALELGRSFIRAEYQKGFAPLLLLWKGIGAFIGRNPQYRVLFGPVSISNQYQAVSRELMISFLERSSTLSDWARLVRPRNAPVRPRLAARACADLDELSDVVSDIETGNAGVPVLLRQYLKLGGKLLGFNVDRDFSNALDGLIVVDLLETEPRLLQRYLGREEAMAFLAYQQRGQNHVTCQHQHQYEGVSHRELGAARHCGGDSAADAFLQVHRGA